MASTNAQSTLAKNLPLAKFLRIALLGSVIDPVSGRKVVVDRNAKKLMNVVGGLLPTLFLILFLTATITPTWPNVIGFLVAIVGAYIMALRATKLVESGS